MIKPLTEKEVHLTIKNVVSSCQDISKLNSRGYNFLYLQIGFIAHYNLHGFKDYYAQNSLKQQLLQNLELNRTNNRTKEDSDYDYYQQKSDIYKAICAKI